MAQRAKSEKPQQRNGKLSIPLPFDEAIQAALEVKPENNRPKGRRKPAKKRG